ncbi:MAG: sulfotransferase domain-containing protein [Candidatus Caenarcaniphilales bacterium]|nr:sulfotransferase domain-containing protein [Candidatus Caenarcaniphilales bacterium]
MSSPILLTTIPKAGTYFFAEILSEIGATNRHLHVAKSHAETLYYAPEEVNRFTPKKAKVPLTISQALYTVLPGEFVFGHIAKPMLEEVFLNRFKIIYSYRDHKEAMQAEFYWFREIRKDMEEEFNKFKHLSVEEHFIKYLEIFGPTRVRLFRFLDMWRREADVLSIDFNKFRNERDYARDKVIEISKYIDMELDSARAEEILDTCFNKDTKTKVKRDKSINLWTPEAEKIYEALQKKQKFYDFAYPVYWKLRDKLKSFQSAV